MRRHGEWYNIYDKIRIGGKLMKKYARVLSVLLCLLMLGSVFAACKREGGNSDSSGSGDTVADTGDYVAEYLPDENFNGRTFTVANFGTENSFDISQDDATNTFDKAKYERNKLIETRYGIEFTENLIATGYDEGYSAYMSNHLSNDYAFDVCKNIMRNAWLAVVGGAVVPLEKLEYCDPSREWYLTFVNEELTINDTLFFAYTYEADTVTRALCCVFFNKKIAEDNSKLEDPYELVDAGTWTIDKMLAMAATAVSDVNGDGKMSIDDDVYGIIAEDDMYIPGLWVGAGFKMIEKDEDGSPYLSASGNEKFIDVLNKAYDAYIADGVLFEGFTQRGQVYQTIVDDNRSFTENHSLFYIGGIYQWESMTDMQDDFGVVPLPKYDENQENYYARVCDGHANCVPTSNPDLRFTSIILEALAVESLNIVNPAYFEDAIENRYLRDPEKSMDIIKMLQKNTIVDLGDSIWMTTGRQVIVDCFRNESRAFASTLDKYAPVVNKQIANDVESILEIIDKYGL